jgi:hypothetical protein
MKTVNEIKDARAAEITCDGDQDDANRFIFDALIGITERLDAMEQPPKVAWMDKEPRTRVECIGTYAPITDEQRKAIERAAMIKALRWALNTFPMLTRDQVRDAITRLENGGEL